MQENITPTERQELREELLKDLDDITTKFGKQNASVYGVVTLLKKLVFPNMFNLGDELRARLDTLEETALYYAGTYDKGQQYEKGALCTHKSGLWHAQETTRDAPGTSKAWRLTSKTPIAARGNKS